MKHSYAIMSSWYALGRPKVEQVHIFLNFQITQDSINARTPVNATVENCFM